MLSVVEESLLRFQGLLKYPIVAIDPGPRKCGVASLSPCEIGGVFLNYTRQEPLKSVYENEKNARTMTDIEVAGIGGNFVRQFIGDVEGPCEILIENQPPGRVTGKGGRTTRQLALSLITAFSLKGWPVTLKTVRSYKECAFGLTVYKNDNHSNKEVSKNFINILAQRYPLVLRQYELQKEADKCDALILLFSRVVELAVELPICHLIGDHHLTRVQLLELILLLVDHAHRLRNRVQLRSEKDLELLVNDIRNQCLQHMLFERLIAQPVVDRGVKSRSTKPKKMFGTHGVPIVLDSHVSHLIIPQQPQTPSSQ